MQKLVVGSIAFVVLFRERWDRPLTASRDCRRPPHPDRSAERLVGPHPTSRRLREGLVALGYQENVQFVIGVRFTQGVFPRASCGRTATRAGRGGSFSQIHGSAAKAAQQATSHIPLFSPPSAILWGAGLVYSFSAW